jgi:hypothetical protein
MASRFLFNEALWDELDTRIPKAKAVRAAVAYLGMGASSLLPLRKGDRLVVDMSLRAVRSGATDPREVQRFLRRGVEVFSRGSLHAKFFIIDKTTIAGSSNISNHAKHSLEEAAVMTDDTATTRRAVDTFEQLCNEPVRKDYLRKCLKEYRPPKFLRGPARSGTTRTVAQGKVWIISGIEDWDMPDAEQAASDLVMKKAQKKLRDFERAEVDGTYYDSAPAFFPRLQEGDWLIVCGRAGRGFDVYPPARFLGVGDYARGGGKRRLVLLQENPKGAHTIRWTTFRNAVPRSLKVARWSRPKTGPIVREADADALLRLWDFRGRFRPRRKGS